MGTELIFVQVLLAETFWKLTMPAVTISRCVPILPCRVFSFGAWPEPLAKDTTGRRDFIGVSALVAG